jgi:glycosyltransferase involved in cell wall biosynthesis
MAGLAETGRQVQHMKVTFVIPWPNMSGGVRVVAIYAERLRQRGHSVLILSSLLRENIPIRRRIKSLLGGRGWSPVRPEPSYLHGCGVEQRVLQPVRQPGDADFPDADVVVATFWNTAYHVRSLPSAKGAKAIFIQNYDEEPGKTNPLVAPTWRMPMHKIVISKWLVELARERFGDDRVSHVPNSVDQHQFHAPPRGRQKIPTVGFLYSKSRFKGCFTSLAAVRRLAETLPSLRVICFGAEKPGLRLRLPSNAEFHHQPPQDKIKDIYAQCDVWMCGSNREGFHLPPLEAMACRCPVVSTRVGGPLDTIVEGKNGHLVEVGDAAALADRVLRVLHLPEDQWTSMSQAAYHTATHYTWDEATDLFENALELAIERTRRGELQGQNPFGALRLANKE